MLSGSGEKFLNAADALIGRKAGKGKWLGHAGTLELDKVGNSRIKRGLSGFCMHLLPCTLERLKSFQGHMFPAK